MPYPCGDLLPWEKGFESKSEFDSYPIFCEYFEKQGYKVRVRNKWTDILPKSLRKMFRVSGGDIDLIAVKNNEIIMVEIKMYWSGDLLRAAKIRENFADYIYLGLISSRRKERYPYGLLELHQSDCGDLNKFRVIKIKQSKKFNPDPKVKRAILSRIMRL